MFAFRHLIPAAFHAVVHMVFLGILCAVIAGGVVLGVAYANAPHWPPSSLTLLAAAVIAVLAGYTVGLTTLVRDVLRGVKGVEQDVVKGVEGK
jgi:ABC-type Fe3+-siderophore transport system permease subunit